jgi:hypothetical protein
MSAESQRRYRERHPDRVQATQRAYYARRHLRYRLPDPEQFWSRITRSEGCWEWPGTRNPKGYGYVSGGFYRMFAHRAAWELAFGPIPKDLCVLHRCDNPPCVRPDHLWLGTIADNNADMAAKGRASRKPRQFGEQHHAALITAADVHHIRESSARGIDLAMQFGISPSTISAIRHRRKWRHLR